MNTSQIVDAIGGSTKVADLCDVSVSAVSQWRKADRIPDARRMYLRLLYPSIFGSANAARRERREVSA